MRRKIDASFPFIPTIVFLSLLTISLTATGCGRFEVRTSVEPIGRTAVATDPAVPIPTLIDETPSASATTPATAVPTTVAPTPAVDADSQTVRLDATYRDTYAGVGMDYPSDWAVTKLDDEQKTQSTTYATSFQSWISGPAGGGGIPEGGAKIDLVVSPNGTLTLEQAVAARRALLQQPDSDAKLIAEEPVLLASGLPGVLMRTESMFGEATQIVTAINGHLVIFAGLGEEEPINRILQTLRPLGEAETTVGSYPVRPTDVQAVRIADGPTMVPIYSGPGDTFQQIAAVQSGLALNVNGITEDARWYRLAGCSEQNPFRPAPSCWISTDPNATLPIRAIGPSQQPVLAVDKQAVLITAPDMAPVHSGPADTYPMIAQLAGGFSFPINGVSEDGNWWRLTGCSSPLNRPLDECWVSADPGITQALDELIPHGPQSSVPPPAEGPLWEGATTITELPRCFNLDAGTVGSDSNPNCDFNLRPHESAGTLFFEPIMPARFGFGGVFPEPPTEAMCAGSQHLSANSEVIAPAAMFYICYQTGNGRFGYLHFLQMTDDPPTVSLEWHTFVE